MRLFVALITVCFGVSASVAAEPIAERIDSRSIQQNNKLRISASTKSSPQYYIALIIDDMGYRYQSGKRAINLPADITYSFLPYAPHARKLANMANSKQKEIMLHIPMEATNGKELGPGGLTLEMPKAIFDLELKHNLSAIPFIKGVNNHMGSLLTQQTEQMTWLMEKLSEKEIYFVDSRTSVNSQALNAARQFGIRSETRDIFVDHDLSPKIMQQQLQQVMVVARRRGSVVVIAHPFPETMKVLEQWLPKAKRQGYKFVYMTKLLKIRQQYRVQRAAKIKLEQEQLSKKISLPQKLIEAKLVPNKTIPVKQQPVKSRPAELSQWQINPSQQNN